MISFRTVLVVSALIASIAISGCGATKQAEQTQSQPKPQTVTTESKKPAVSILQGTQNMRDVLKEMKEQLSKKDEDNAIKTSDKLEGNWSNFEDNVKEKYADLYEKVEKPLGAIQAAVKVKPLDNQTLSNSMNELEQVLAQIQLENGTQNMKDALKEMKEELGSKNEDKAIKTSEQLENNWSVFENCVKDKSADLYEKVEKPLGAIQAGVKIKPSDAKALNASIDQLDNILTQVQKLK